MPLNPPIDRWTGRTAWLLGASSGIGRATASRLHALGATVVVSARSQAALQEFVDAHPGSMALPLDVVDRGAMQSAAAAILQAHGTIDLAMYCAGVFKPLRATDFDLDEALRQLQINYTGALHLLDAVLPALLRQAEAGRGGHLSLVSSVTGYRGLPTALGYGPTKAALINLAETLYLDLSARGIGVSVINPGYVDTPATAQNAYTMPALISAEQAAREIVDGWARGRFEIHFPKRFTRVLKFARLLGDRLYFAGVRRVTGL
jgi:NAD(P)-dependent dehydrogenase (short-subunit alcohol dehydrogenase family)